MDLVKIGFLIKADGLKEANTQANQLLDKVDNIGVKGKKAATDFESSQTKVASASKKATKEVDATTKALDKQKLVGDYLGQGLDKTTATAIANFKQLGASTTEVNQMLSQLGKNSSIIQVRKDVEQARIEQQKLTEQVNKTINSYQTLSQKSFGGGILDSIDKQNKGLQDLNKHYSSIEKAQAKQSEQVLGIVSQYEKLSSKSLGGGILNTVDKQNKGLSDLNKYYQGLEDAQEKSLSAERKINQERQRAVSLEQVKAKYASQGYGKTDAAKLARMEVSGADVATLNQYKQHLNDVNQAYQSLKPTIDSTSQSHSKFTDQVKGIAIYAALSAAIYGVMTTMTNLAVATVKMADEYTAIQNRMKLYIKDSEELGQVNAKLAQYAMENNVGLRETATLFARLAPSMQKLGANTAAITSVVDAFGKSMRIGGATAMEAASATIQFSQAMAAGKLQGDEFRSISEASPRFLRAIAEGAGIAASQLKEMSSAGMLTTEVISKALLREYPKLIEENAKLGVTLEQGANAIKTTFTMMIGEFNEGAGATQFLGNSMMSLARNMGEAAQTARASGTAVKTWFKDNAAIISGVAEAFKVLAIVIASRYVAAIILARVESIRYQATLLSMAAAQTQVTRTSTLLAAALTGVGNAAKGALAFFGGWVGLGLTIASVAASYLLMNSASSKTVESLKQQGDSIDDVIAKYKEMTSLQKESALINEKQNLKNLTDEYTKQRDALVTNALALSRKNKMTSEEAKEISRVTLGYKAGSITLEDFKNKVLQSGSISKEAKDKIVLLAAGVETSGLKAKDAAQLVKILEGNTKSMGDAAIVAGQKFNKLADDFAKATEKNKLTLKTMQQFGLNQSYASKIVESAQAAYDTRRGEASSAEAKAQAKINEAKKLGVDVSKAQAKLDQIKLDNERKLRGELQYNISTQVEGAKAAQASEDAISNYTSSLKDANKEAAKAANEVNPFPEQAESLQRMIDLLNQGVEADVARIASQKEYVKWFGLSITQAEELANLEKQRAYLEAQAQARTSYSQGLLDQSDELAVINDFLAEGVMLEQAKVIAAAKYQANAVGYSMIVRNMVNELATQSDLLYEQVVYQEAINSKKAIGFSDERAALEYRIEKLREAALLSGKALSDEQENVIETVRNNLIASEHNKKRFDYESKIKDVKDQIANTLNFETLAMADIANSNKDLSKEAVRELAIRNEILESFKKQKEIEQQKSENPFMDIDFSVFGDFGNPFQSALEGLNSLLFGMDNLAAKYEERKKYLQTDVDKAQKGTEEEVKAKAALAQLEKNYITDVARMKEKRIEDGLKLTKLMFKEDSKGYKLMSALEMAYQAKSIAMEIKNFAIKKGLLAADTMAFQAATAKRMLLDGVATAATVANNMVKATSSGIAALASSMVGLPFPLNLAAFAATGALLASIGLNLAGGGSAKGTFAPTNEGTGTVFGDTDAKSESIKKSIDLLADNSDLMLPLTDAMLRSLRNIESNIGGLTNLLIRTGVGKDFNIAEGFEMNAIGSGISNIFSLVNDLTFGVADFLTLGLFSAVGDLLGGLFGTKTTVKGQGLYGRNQTLESILENGFSLQEYVAVNTKKKTLGVTTSNKNKTMFSAADQQLANQFTLIFEGFYDSILNASTVLGMDVDTVADALEGTVISIGKINLKGLKGEEIQEKLMAVFGAAADKLAQTAVKGLDDFQQVGEGYYETLVRVATGIEQANYFTDRLNVTAIKYTDIINKQGDVAAEIVRQSVLLVDTTKNIKGGFYDLVNTFDGSAEELTNFIFTLRDLQDQLFMTGKDADYLTSAMILGAGGLDKLSSGFDAYFEMLSPAEQAAELTRRLTNEFAIFGKELPADVKAFRNLVSSIDISSEAGQKLYGQIIALAPEFNDLQDALESANSEVNTLVQSLRDLAEQARAARGETEQPHNLDYVRSQFEATSLLAMQGDVDAANRLLDLGNDLMTLSKTYSVTGGEYAKDLAAVQRAATVSADVQEAGLGYTIGSSLTPVSGTNTAPTVEANDSANTAEIKAMREDLNAALFAIAKYTQDTANRLERWDYGDRMVVRVEQDATDVIKVETV